jgi:hypothetical protein
MQNKGDAYRILGREPEDERRLCDQGVDGWVIPQCSVGVWTEFNKPSIG